MTTKIVNKTNTLTFNSNFKATRNLLCWLTFCQKNGITLA